MTIVSAATSTIRTRRTQADRTAETRSALIEAAIQVIYRTGYNSATTAAIADEAGVSRGAIIYHFGTRAQLMADVIASVYEREHEQYEQLQKKWPDSSAVAEWPEMLWQVLSQPSGMAVIEILQASRSDPELAGKVKPAQERIELISARGLVSQTVWDNEKNARAATRLFVWAIRGLAIAQVLMRDPAEINLSIQLFRKMVDQTFGSGRTSRHQSGRAKTTAPQPPEDDCPHA
jgi:AcrR family transcriptional regulator